MEKINLCIDIGNTKTKAAIFRENEMIELFPVFESEKLTRLQKEYNRLSIIYTASGTNEALESVLLKTKNCQKLNYKTRLPIAIDYSTPETLGGDRVAAAVAAANFHPNQPCLIIDYGTCITIDFVNEKTFFGGMISPGIAMRLNAMHHFTQKLPLVSINEKITYPGKSTEECLQLGAYQSVKWEILGCISQFKNQHYNLKIIEIINHASPIEKEIKIPIFAAPNLVLQGLNLIQLFNDKK
jgi:type III pantothenate kinase